MTASLLDAMGNALRFDGFCYERGPVADYHDSNWLRCNITLDTSVIRHTFEAALLTEDLQRLVQMLRDSVEAESLPEAEFEPLEPHINLTISLTGGVFDITARLDLNIALGPVLEYRLECSRDSVRAFLGDLQRIACEFPIRGTRG